MLLWPSNQLSATTNLCKTHCVTCGGVLFSFHYVHLHLYNFLYEPLLLLIIFAVRPYHWLLTIATRGFISMNHYCETSQQSRPGFSKPRFLCPFVQPDTTLNQLCALCFPFTGGLSCSSGCVCFIWTQPRPWPSQINSKEKWARRINLQGSRGKYLLRSFKAFANKGDLSSTFKWQILASFIYITSKTSRRVCSAFIYPLTWEMLPLFSLISYLISQEYF